MARRQQQSRTIGVRGEVRLVIASIILAPLFVQTVRTQSVSNNEIEVSTRLGVIIGSKQFTTIPKNQTFYQFLGIPYAEAPKRFLRFRPPIPKQPWKDSYNASSFGNTCVQVYKNRVFGDEDCLFLNVYTPRVPRSPTNPGRGVRPAAFKAVMVFIHGGSFVSGSGNGYAPDLLMDKDVVLVTFNYRLGPFGFFSTGYSLMAGNQGLLDQVMVLKWVKENIAPFGGDPDRVTIFGQESGATSVYLHLLSPLSKGLFHRAIGMSGTPLMLSQLNLNEQKITEHSSWYLIEEFHCEGSRREAQILKCMQSIRASDLEAMALSNSKPFETLEAVSKGKQALHFSWTTATGSFLPDDPLVMAMSGAFASHVPFMTGIVSQDGAGLAFPLLEELDTLNANWTELATDLVYAKFGNDTTVYQTGSVRVWKKFYVGEGNFSLTNLNETLEQFTDWGFVLPTWMSAQLHMRSKRGSPHTYVYKITHRPSRSIAAVSAPTSIPADVISNLGPVHDDNLHFIFPNYLRTRALLSENDNKTSEYILTYWTQFAKTGDPSPFIQPDSPLAWVPFGPTEDSVMEIGPEPELVSELGSAENLHLLTKLFWEDEINDRIGQAN